MRFKDKTILIISQQDWGKMFISKHHYAVALAKLGNRVFFLNSPEKSGSLKSGDVQLESTDYDNLQLVRHRFFYPYIIKHKFKALHIFLLKYHLKQIIQKIGGKVDVVWSFDVSDTVSLKSFPDDCLKIFMPVDEPRMPAVGAETADVLLSVTNEIINKYNTSNLPAMFVNHGVSDVFINENIDVLNNEQPQVGLSGNFLRPDIDWVTLKDIIVAHPNVIFNFWGAFDNKDGNLSVAADTAEQSPKEKLASLHNAHFHGAVNASVLADNLKKMDCFLICYDIAKDQSGGTNYHKVLEFIATGNVVVSNNISTYANHPELVTMPAERNNTNLPALFTTVINNLDSYNSAEKRRVRVKYAKEHTYAGNINRIEKFITEVVGK